jgi:hypothetical protein
MLIVDDPMLALIVRFVADGRDIDISDGELQRQQIRAIGDYVSRFPPEEKNARAMEWIAENAQRYRRQWQRRVVTAQLSDSRCPDCPLVREDGSLPCEIHGRWLETLNSYLEDEISSTQYVENALKLLQAHKARLKVAGVGGLSS